MKNWDYTREVKLKHNETLWVGDKVTGDLNELVPDKLNAPVEKSYLNYKHFNIVDSDLFKKLSKYFTMEELGIIAYMASMAEFNTNSLKPLSDETSLRELEELFNTSKNRVGKIMDKLFKFGVYLQIKVYKNELKEYWVLNPNISWKGRLKDDSIFKHFKNTDISKLVS